jgi:hypothetical protein
MSSLSILDSFKLLLGSTSGKKYRCSWCDQRFEKSIELSEHIGDTKPWNSDRGQECVPAYRCDWCDVRFEHHLGLSDHIRGATRSSSASKPICVLDPLDSSSRLSRVNDESLRKSSNTDQAATEIPNSEHGLDEKTDNSSLLNSHHCEIIGEEDEERSMVSKTEDIATVTVQADGAILKTFTDFARSMPPPPPASVNRQIEHRDPNYSGSYEYRQQNTRAYGVVDRNPMQTGLSPSNSKTSAYNLPTRLDTNASQRSYATARTSSTASYRTAPSFSRRTLPSFSSRLDTTSNIDLRLVNLSLPPLPENLQDYHSGSRPRLDVEAKTVDELEQQLITEASRQLDVSVDEWDPGELATIIYRHKAGSATLKKFSLASLASKIEETVTEICEAINSRAKQPSRESNLRGAVARHTLDYFVHFLNLKYLTISLERQFCQISSGLLGEKKRQVFSSQWIEHLRSRGILLDPMDELDWSGQGQHVEYETKDEKDIPLKAGEVLGHSATAIVESVRCRRIKLARKRIRCSRRLTKEIAIVEVEHLHRLQHAHILRVVGTYTLKRDLAILLYPATPWNLDEFMDELLDTGSVVNADVLKTGTWRRRAGAQALRSFFGCLANALEAIHKMNIKHMDIKPKNLLVRPYRMGDQSFKVYVADFGIVRAYKSADESETDSPISFTRTYAAPEVIQQDTRGFSADIFSLGCVFMEMLATSVSKPGRNERQTLVDVLKSHSGDSSFHANLADVQSWYQETFLAEPNSDRDDTFLPGRLLDVVPKMVQGSPAQRPSATALLEQLEELCCNACHDGPEPFEAADKLAD